MKHAKLDNEHNSGTMLPTARRPRLGSSERIFLSDQAADAKAAILRTVEEVNDTLTRIVDVRSHAKRHPWLVVGSLVTAGAIAGALLVPAIRKSTAPRQNDSDLELQPSGSKPASSHTTKSCVVTTAIGLLSSVLQTIIVNHAIAAVEEAYARRRVRKTSLIRSKREVRRNN
jgi:hypothetical protein